MKAFPPGGLYAIADTGWVSAERLLSAVTGAITGGGGAIQLRDKAGIVTCDLRLLNELRNLCRQHQVPLIINDDTALAAKLGADGIHIGQTDHGDEADIQRLRTQLGPRAIIGVSCHDNLDSARQAVRAGADYVAFGRFFSSRTKPDAPEASLETLRAARRELDVPIVAIGGITPDNGAGLLKAGADWLAVIAGIFAQVDTRTAAARYQKLIQQHQALQNS